MDSKDDITSRDVFDYKLHFTVLVCIVIAEYIGIFNVSVADGLNVIILPLVYSLVLGMAVYLFKPFKWIGDRQSHVSSSLMLIFIGPLIAKLAIASGQNISILISAGPALLLEEVGDVGAIFIALPVALLLGFKREAIGMSSSICREPQMAVIIDKYGFESKEVKGFMAVYLIGTVLGTIFISFIVNILVYFIPLHPYAYAIACGVGSTSMNVAAVSSLIAMYPALSAQLQAFSGIANLISVVLSIYVYIIISLPLTEKLYSVLEPVINKYIFKHD